MKDLVSKTICHSIDSDRRWAHKMLIWYSPFHLIPVRYPSLKKTEFLQIFTGTDTCGFLPLKILTRWLSLWDCLNVMMRISKFRIGSKLIHTQALQSWAFIYRDDMLVITCPSFIKYLRYLRSVPDLATFRCIFIRNVHKLDTACAQRFLLPTNFGTGFEKKKNNTGTSTGNLEVSKRNDIRCLVF